MEIYTLDSNFKHKDVVDNYQSLIWTERYSASGDVTVVTPATLSNINLLKEGTFLASSESNEVMLCETQTIEKGQLKVTGDDLSKFLNNRTIRVSSNYKDKTWTLTGTPQATMLDIVRQMCTSASSFAGEPSIAIDLPKQLIPFLGLAAVPDPSDPQVTIAVSYGPLYDAIKQIAESFSLGFKLYLASASDTAYSLTFQVYKGIDRTSSKTVDPVRFAPSLDSLADSNEIRSIAMYKNVAYAFAPSVEKNTTEVPPGVAYAPGTDPNVVGFGRRVLQVFADDIQSTEEAPISNADLKAMLDQRARDALANNNYTRIFDGEVVPQNQYTFGKHYFLGDIVELVNSSGDPQRARITEYIRTKDNTGERAYPTVSVLT